MYETRRKPVPGIYQTSNSRLSGLFGTLGLILVLSPLMFWYLYTNFRIEVPTKHIAILTAKTGKDLDNGQEMALEPSYKGVQLEPLGEGRYYRNPYLWDWEVIPQTEVPAGKLGVKIRLYGDDLPYGHFLATETGQKGIVPEVLTPGRYKINPYAYTVELHEPVDVPAGFKGVVTNLAGPLPEDPNTLLVEPGYRGVQKQTVNPGTHYINPYLQRINLVDCRSQRIDLAVAKDLGFPSKDGFWINLAASMEFKIDPERAAEVFVTYNELEESQNNYDTITDEIRNKVLLPNARSFCRLKGSNSLGREFIQGDTRTEFQGNFEKAMQQTCKPLGIEIVQALIGEIKPPMKIAKPVQEREIAKQDAEQYRQQILQQDSEKTLAIEKAKIKQKQALVAAQQEVIQVVTKAMQLQEVAVTKGEERLAVAKYALEAAKDKAEATLARGKAAAQVIHLENGAEAAGWKNSVEAFGGDGFAFARYVMLQKMAPAYQEIMANTADSPIMDVFRSFATPGSNSAVVPTAKRTATQEVQQ